MQFHFVLCKKKNALFNKSSPRVGRTRIFAITKRHRIQATCFHMDRHKERHICWYKDLTSDPFRLEIGTHRLRSHRFECKICRQRFNVWEKMRHTKLCVTKYNLAKSCKTVRQKRKWERYMSVNSKRLCLYCDKYTFRTDKHKCPVKDYYYANMDRILADHEVLRTERIKWLLKTQRPPRPHKPIKTHTIQIPKVKVVELQTYLPRHFLSYPKDVTMGPLKTETTLEVALRPTVIVHYPDEVTFLPRKSQWTKLTNEEIEAAKGLMTLEEYYQREEKKRENYRQWKEELLRTEPGLADFMEREKLKHQQWLENMNFHCQIDDDEILAWVSPQNSPRTTLKRSSSGILNAAKGFEQFVESTKLNGLSTLRNPKIQDYSDINALLELYKPLFPLMSEKDLMKPILDCGSLGYYSDGKLVGALTYKKLSVKLDFEESFVNVILASVNDVYQKRGIGRHLLDMLNLYFPKVVVWADNGSIPFYLKNGFSPASKMWFGLQDIIPHYGNSKFCQRGFSKPTVKRCENRLKTAIQNLKNLETK